MNETLQVYEQVRSGEIFLLILQEEIKSEEMSDIMLSVNGKEFFLHSDGWTHKGTIPEDQQSYPGLNLRMARQEIEEKGFSVQHTIMAWGVTD